MSQSFRASVGKLSNDSPCRAFSVDELLDNIANGSCILTEGGSVEGDPEIHSFSCKRLTAIMGGLNLKFANSETRTWYTSTTIVWKTNDGAMRSSNALAMEVLCDCTKKEGQLGKDYCKTYMKVGFSVAQINTLIKLSQEAFEAGAENVDLFKFTLDPESNIVWVNINLEVNDVSKGTSALKPKFRSGDLDFNAAFESDITRMSDIPTNPNYRGVYESLAIFKLGLSCSCPHNSSPDLMDDKSVNLSMKLKELVFKGTSDIPPPTTGQQVTYSMK
jgi:hypothetical protein